MDELRAASMDASSDTFGTFVRKPTKRATSLSASLAESQPLPTPAAPALVNDWVEVGAVAGAYGVRGWIKIYPHAQIAKGDGALLHAKHWQLVAKDGQTQSVTVCEAKLHGGNNLVAQLASCASRDEAEALKGQRINVSRADFPAPQADEYYWVDLIGLDVITEAGVALGQVTGLLDSSAHAILQIAYSKQGKDGAQSQAERLIPFVHAHVSDVDLIKRQIVVNWEEDI